MISETVCCACAASISTAATLAPSRAKRRAADFPIPDAAPVISATLFASFIFFSPTFQKGMTRKRVRSQSQNKEEPSHHVFSSLSLLAPLPSFLHSMALFVLELFSACQ